MTTLARALRRRLNRHRARSRAARQPSRRESARHGWSRSTNRRSAARRGATRRLIRASSTTSAAYSPARARRKHRGYQAGRFSFNAKGGRCETCQGQGVRQVEMNFLPDLYVTCPVCHGHGSTGKRYPYDFRDRSIADVLAMSIDEAVGFFENFAVDCRVLATLVDVGLGYLTLGQPSTTLSGGEAQRIKLATELSRGDTGHTLYILDEPTTGLHIDDIRRLLIVLNRLVDQGNTCS